MGCVHVAKNRIAGILMGISMMVLWLCWMVHTVLVKDGFVLQLCRPFLRAQYVFNGWYHYGLIMFIMNFKQI